MDETSDVLSPEWVEAHNGRVKAFWRRVQPKIAAMTEAQAERIVDLGMRQGMSMNRIAITLREEFGFDEDEMKSDIAIGGALYHRALEMGDLYDDDFRPRPRWDEIGPVGHGTLRHNPAAGEFEVVVGERSHRFRQSHAPKYGVDTADMARAQEIAAALAEGREPEADGPEPTDRPRSPDA